MLRHEDLAKIARQLGRQPQGVADVVKRCLAGHPQVITNYPIRWCSGTPEIFPTLYWLTCPVLRRQVGALETEGWIERVQKRLASDVPLAEKLQAAHQAYADKRLQLVPGDEMALLARHYPGQLQALKESGIGGIRGEGIKCLHTHLADYLADQTKLNPIGKLVVELLRDRNITIDYCFDYQMEGLCRG